MLITQKIKRNINGNIPVIKIPLISQDLLSGDEQSIDRYVNNETLLSVNPVIDGEKFLYKRVGNFSTRFDFYNQQSSSYVDSLIRPQAFTQDDFDQRSSSLQNSFFIAQYYDSVDLDNQILLHTSYFNGYEFISNNGSTVFNSGYISGSELDQIFLEENFLRSKTEDSFNIFVRYYFFD